MKKILVIGALALTIGVAQAQIKAGSMMLGGSVGYTSQDNEGASGGNKVKTFHISPQAGYFIADNIAIGLQVSYYHDKATVVDDFNNQEYENNYSSTSFSPFIRYYIFTPNEKFAFYADAQAGIGFSSIDNEALDMKYDGRNFSVYLSPGFSYFFNEKWALDLELNGISYVSNDRNTDADAKDDKNSTFTFGLSSFNPSLGIRYFINK